MEKILFHSFHYDFYFAFILLMFSCFVSIIRISTMAFTGYPGISCLLYYEKNKISFIQFFQQFLCCFCVVDLFLILYIGFNTIRLIFLIHIVQCLFAIPVLNRD